MDWAEGLERGGRELECGRSVGGVWLSMDGVKQMLVAYTRVEKGGVVEGGWGWCSRWRFARASECELPCS